MGLFLSSVISFVGSLSFCSFFVQEKLIRYVQVFGLNVLCFVEKSV